MFRFMSLKPALALSMIALFLGLLGILATLQFRWVGQVSAREGELMQASLRRRADDFRDDFNRQISLAYSSFQMNADTLLSSSWDNYGRGYDHWITTAPHPQLVKDVFLAQRVEDGQLNLSRFNHTKRRFEASTWSSDMARLRQKFEGQATVETEISGRQSNDVYLVDEEIPALVLAIPAANKRGQMTYVDWSHPLGHVIIKLDLDYIKTTLIPVLASQHLADGQMLNYDLTVVSRKDPKRIIYQSNRSSASEEAGKSDASVYFFNVGIDQTASFSTKDIYQTPGSTNKTGSRGPSSSTIVIPQMESTNVSPNTMMLVDEGSCWQLILKHRTGSLATVVANTRRRNLLVSFGILTLLAISGILIIAAGHRAAALGRRQMEFVASVSHEFRTPLAVVYALSENLADGVVSNDPEVIQSGVLIRDDTRRLAEMVEQVLEFAGVEHGRQIHPLSLINLNKVLGDLVTKQIRPLEKKGWTVEEEIDPQLPPVLGDAVMLERAVENLLNNAMKYRGENHWIAFSAKVRGQRTPEVQITVADKGIGIAPSDIPHLFEPFYRSKEVTNAQIHGNGLGLSFVKRIIEAHGGRITIESTRGLGSRFTLHLPLARNDEDQAGRAV